MPPWIPLSIFGAILSVIYTAVAIFAVISERGSVGGSWITLHGMLTFLITLPVSLIGEKLGMRPDYRSNADMAFAIGVCAVLVYLLGAGLARLARVLFSGAGAG